MMMLWMMNFSHKNTETGAVDNRSRSDRRPTMKTLSIDIETFSDYDLKKCGVYRYSESLRFEILLFGFSVDSSDVQVVDLTVGETIPSEIIDAIIDDNVQKWAFNCNFERICISRFLRDKGISFGEEKYLNTASWRCTMVWSAFLALPMSLEGVGSVLGLEKQKLTTGRELIRFFCSPCKPTAANGNRTRNLPKHAPEKWEMFKTYNQMDVETELAIQKRLINYPVPDSIWSEFELDQKINDTGIKVDLQLVKSAIEMDVRSRTKLTHQMKELTDLQNPNSVAQMKSWLAENGVQANSLGKKAVAEMIKTAPDNLSEVLSLRQQLAKSSVKKYQAMSNAACSDGRARGMFQFLGAARTGRWAGRLIQLQNLPQNHIEELETVRELVKHGNFEALELLYNSVPGVLSELIRTAFVPKDGCKLIVADFSAIEARVIAWFAGETWRNEVFATHGRIYEASASAMFHVPIESVTKGSSLRQKGKIAELALGFGGGTGALMQMGALEMGLKMDELQPLVSAWRQANPNIVRFWRDVDRAALTAVSKQTTTETHGIRFAYQNGMLFITLPSGRRLSYVKPRIGTNRFGSDCITFMGVGATKKWGRIETYGAKIVENVVQGTSRDLLAYAMQTLRQYSIIGHIHDEILVEVDPDISSETICQQMSCTPPWAKGLLLRADGFECAFYRKD
jgi:DNA polymerase